MENIDSIIGLLGVLAMIIFVIAMGVWNVKSEQKQKQKTA